MFRTVSFVLVLIAGAWIAPIAVAAEYESKELADAGTQYRQDLLDRVPANPAAEEGRRRRIQGQALFAGGRRSRKGDFLWRR
jgi:hypothetical protein